MIRREGGTRDSLGDIKRVGKVYGQAAYLDFLEARMASFRQVVFTPRHWLLKPQTHPQLHSSPRTTPNLPNPTKEFHCLVT